MPSKFKIGEKVKLNHEIKGWGGLDKIYTITDIKLCPDPKISNANVIVLDDRNDLIFEADLIPQNIT